MARTAKILDSNVIVNRHIEGDPVSRIANDLHVHNDRIEAILRQNGVEIRKGAWGSKHPRWNGGRYVDVHGYVQVTLSRYHPFRSMITNASTVREHRLVMAIALGRPLTSDETVHHIDGNTCNNELSNLQLRHGPHGEGTVLTCRDCGSNNIEKSAL